MEQIRSHPTNRGVQDRTRYTGSEGQTLEDTSAEVSQQPQGERGARVYRGTKANAKEKDYIKTYFLENVFKHSHLN